jgi:DNA-binding transcriptional ArsR family regulator
MEGTFAQNALANVCFQHLSGSAKSPVPNETVIEMLRIWFSADDLGRVRVARQPHALWETVLSLQTLQTRQRTVLPGWRDAALTRLATPRSSAALRVLWPLVPARGYFPDFLTPSDGEGAIADGIAAVLNTPVHRVAIELGRLAGSEVGAGEGGRAAGGVEAAGAKGGPGPSAGPVPPESSDHEPSGEPASAACGDEASASGWRLDHLGEALAHYHRTALGPYMPRIRALVDADRAVRARALMDGGVEELLGTLRPTLRWCPPVLEVDYPVDQELRLDGRGLLLVPSVFCDRTPISLLDPSLPPTLVYSVGRLPDDPADRAEADDSLAALIGSTRGEVLRRLGEAGASTSELARLVGISVASASQHASVLRRSGLVVSRRAGNTVVHRVSPLGTALIHGGDHPGG